MIARVRSIHVVVAFAITALLLVVYSQYDNVLGRLSDAESSSKPLPEQSSGASSKISASVAPSVASAASSEPSQDAAQAPRRAYATFLSTRIESEKEKDPYFTATRVLAYQLLHQKATRTRLDIPFIVLVPPHVSAIKRQILTSEGAVVIEVKNLEPTTQWLHPGETRFVDQFTKLRLFELTAYERILYMDSDMLLTRHLDDIWDEEVALQVQSTQLEKSQSDATNVTSPPSDFLIAGISDTRGPGHDFPPPEGDELNGGFILLRPDKVLFEHYRSLLNVPDLFDSGLMEQSLLNHAHRRDGPMPWKAFPPGKWNVNWPSEKDVQGGCATLHDKFWDEANKDWIARSLVEKWWRVQGRAEGFWQERE